MDAARTPAPVGLNGEAPINGVAGHAEHYGAFLKLCHRRIQALNIPYATVDELCGFPLRYTAKIMAQTKIASGFTLFTLARALALLPNFEHDEKQLAKLQSHQEWIPYKWPPSRRGKTMLPRNSNGRNFRISPVLLHEFSTMLNDARTQKLSPEQRSAIARKAARTRWRNERRASK